MEDQKKLRKLMDDFGILDDCFDFDEDFTEQTKRGFIREYLNIIDQSEVCDHSVKAIECANDHMKENFLNFEYFLLVQEKLIENVFNYLEDDVRHILGQYQKIYHHM
jgi:carboxypeptidase C (cathepsin A)